MVYLAGYELQKKIFMGHRSIVYGAIRLADQLPVVVKVSAQSVPDSVELKRYRREFELGSRFQHEHIIGYLGLERHPNGLALIEEDFGGVALRGHIPDKGMDPALFLKLALQLTEGLQAVHAGNIIHKDIKPGNIVIAGETVKIIDFGIASELSRETRQVVGPAVLEGTLTYISPEQTGRVNRHLDYRSDYYSLGATFYEMLTGVPVFQTDDLLEMIHCHIAKVPVQPDRIRKSIPAGVSQIVMKLLEKNAEARYQSGFGLKADLAGCLRELETEGKVSVFTPGASDYSEKFQVSQKLYGREQEIETLVHTFDEVADGHTTMALVSGYAGVGKSRLVNELRAGIASRRGYMVSGKFDQFQRDVAYSALVFAFEELANQILGEEEEAVRAWQHSLRQVLGPNGRVIVDFIPDWEHLIGVWPPLPELADQENRNRFHLVFRDFISVLAQKNHPLVLFLDDLQWADAGSLELISQLLSWGRTESLMVIGAFRDNEIRDSQWMSLSLDEIKKAKTNIVELHLESLKTEHIAALLADTLGGDLQCTQAPADLLTQKTRGNPFFLNELLHMLHGEGLVHFSQELGRWDWDLEQIRRAEVGDTAAAFMVSRLKQLPAEVQKALQLAACIGNLFDLETLAYIEERKPRDVAESLRTAARFGLITPLDEDFRLAHLLGNEKDETVPKVRYKFGHDRIQEAAYSLIDKDRLPEVHLHIGRLLLRQCKHRESEKIFEIVRHLNRGSELVTEPEERLSLVRLNKTAAEKANAASAFRSALPYLETALALLPEDTWERHYRLTFDLVRSCSHTAFWAGQPSLAETRSRLLLDRAQTTLEKAETLCMRADQYTLIGNVEKAIDAGLHGLRLLGDRLTRNPSRLSIEIGRMVLSRRLSEKSILNLMNLPEMKEPKALLRLKLLMNMITAAHAVGYRKLIWQAGINMVQLILRYGKCPDAAPCLSGFAMMLCGSLSGGGRGFNRGGALARLAIDLNRSYRDIPKRCRTLMVSGYALTWTEHWREFVAVLKQAIKAGLEGGDLLYMAYASYQVVYWEPALDLLTCLANGEDYLALIADANYPSMSDSAHILQQYRAALCGKTQGPFSLDDDTFDEAACLARLEQARFLTGVAVYHVVKLKLCFFHQDNALALEQVDRAAGMIKLISSQTYTVEYYLYSFLVHAALYPTMKAALRKKARRRMREAHRRMKKWAAFSPLNFRHHYLLMEAELARLKKKNHRAAELYARAAAAAKESEYPQFEACANELAARFHLERGTVQVAAVHLIDAYSFYLKWGATVKVKLLERQYGQSLLKIKTLERFSGTEQERVSGTMTAVATLQDTDSTNSTNAHALDMASVSKSAMAISGEINLARLLERMMRIIIESVGAQRGFFIMETEQGLRLQASADMGSDEVAVVQDRPLDQGPPLSAAIVRYVIRTGKNVVLANATARGPYTNCPHVVKHRPKSVLCTPVRQQDRITGALYLENNLVSGAFNETRVQVLDILVAQAVISLENARLFEQARMAAAQVSQMNENLERRVKERTAQLRSAQRELTQQAHQAGMAEIATTVLHNVGNILNSVITSSQIIQNKVESSKLKGLVPAGDLLRRHKDQLQEFLVNDPKGRKLVDYFIRIGGIMEMENQTARENMERLVDKIYAIKDVIMAQQSYASMGFRNEPLQLKEVVEQALDMQDNLLGQDRIDIDKRYGEVPTIPVQKVKLIHTLINLLKNAREAMAGMKPEEKKITITIDRDEAGVFLKIADTGPGISKEHLDKIFAYGFTTKSDGHGFGLHGCANAMTEMGGSISVQSGGNGQGAAFTLKFPVETEAALLGG
ncbi:MAG: AAA family ATPase [Acidobacteriota bacterium]|nr:AAA family ATPase [Acidobacteriota bacterium]